MYHLIWGKMVMSVCHLAVTDLFPTPTCINVGKHWRGMQDAGTGSVRGRCACASYWEQVLCAPPWVLETLRNGYILPFYTEPTPYVRPNQNSSQIEVHVEFVTNAAAELLKGGYIEEVKELPVAR